MSFDTLPSAKTCFPVSSFLLHYLGIYTYKGTAMGTGGDC